MSDDTFDFTACLLREEASAPPRWGWDGNPFRPAAPDHAFDHDLDLWLTWLATRRAPRGVALYVHDRTGAWEVMAPGRGTVAFVGAGAEEAAAFLFGWLSGDPTRIPERAPPDGVEPIPGAAVRWRWTGGEYGTATASGPDAGALARDCLAALAAPPR